MSDDYPYFPQIHRQPPAVDFIDHHLYKHHPAFACPQGYYDPTAEQYVRDNKLQITRNVPIVTVEGPDHDGNNVKHYERMSVGESVPDVWEILFPKAMALFMNKAAVPKGRIGSSFNIRDKTDWMSVLGTLEAAKAQYCEKRENHEKGGFRDRLFRLKDNPAPVAQCLNITSNVVPGNSYTTPIFGILGLIVDAWQTMVDVREAALDGFDGLPSLFRDIEESLQEYPTDERIHTACLELTVSILEGVEQGITFFISDKVKKALKYISFGDQYAKEMQTSLSQIKEKSANLNTRFGKSHMHKSEKNDEQQKEITELLVDLSIGARNDVLSLLKEYRFMRYDFKELQRSVRYHQPDMVPMREVVSQYALRSIIVGSDIDLHDVAAVAGIKWRFSEKEFAQAESLIRTPEFRQWIVSPKSTKLLAYWETAIFVGLSPVSAVCSTMLRTLALDDHFLPLIWFGGRHVNRVENGEEVGKFAMVRSLIEQLLRQHEFNMQLLPYPVDSITSCEDYVMLLSWLIRQLPETRTVYCIIDGVALLERDRYWHEACPVLVELFRLTNDDSLFATVKLLLTSTPPRYVRQAFRNDGLVLNVAAVSRSVTVPSDARVARELGHELAER